MNRLPIWKIKCITCKCEFSQEQSTIRNCDKCRVIKKNKMREKWNKKRRQARGIKK
jgi:hypothetical protein